MTARVLILGDNLALAEALARRLRQLGAEAETARAGKDTELAAKLSEPGWTALAVLSHDDALALRLTLLSAHIRPELPLWVSLFDKTIAHQVREIVPEVNVVPTSQMVARELADQCERLAVRPASRLGNGVRLVDDALRLVVIAGAGLILTLVVQTLITIVALHDDLVDALYYSTRTVATVADVPGASTAPDWFKLIATASTVVAVVFLAIFTAALVRRLARARLTTLFGARRVARRGHVLVVGFGQIGFRLAHELQQRGFSVVALERDIDAPCVRLARRAGIPVVIGRGDDRAILELIGVRHCAAVAAVTSDDLANVSVGLAANDVRPQVPLVMRLGDGDVAAETESLFHLGQIVDAHALIAEMLAGAVRAHDEISGGI